MSPAEPATVGALVNVHVLQVHIHTNNTPVTGKEPWKDEDKRTKEKRRRGELEILRGINKR